jgi:hypothetical protein
MMERHGVFGLLAATGPSVDHADKLMLYGQFVGSWDIEGTWFQENGERRTRKGHWHFDWILGGRGIQDVLFATGAPPDRFGTTLRCYDPDLDAWHITWMQPSAGEFVHLIGRKVGDRIVQQTLASDQGRRERWIFADIAPRSFLWLGEVSLDDGATWRLEQEMRATKRTD